MLYIYRPAKADCRRRLRTFLAAFSSFASLSVLVVVVVGVVEQLCASVVRDCAVRRFGFFSVGRNASFGRSIQRHTSRRCEGATTHTVPSSSMSRHPPAVLYDAARPLSPSRCCFLQSHHHVTAAAAAAAVAAATAVFVVVFGPPRSSRVDQTSRSLPGDAIKT